MKILFLGTSAGESYPGVWCACPNCAYARARGGRNLRMNTGTMIDDDVLLDDESEEPEVDAEVLEEAAEENE